MEFKDMIKLRVSGLSAQLLESRSVTDPQTPSESIINEIRARHWIIAEALSQMSALKARYNEFLPIHRLPVELLTIILSMALPLGGYHKGRTNLLLVCRTWFNVINTNPATFWTTLSADDPPSQYDRLLQLCQQMPITIYIDQYHASVESSVILLEGIKSKRLAFRELVWVGGWNRRGVEMLVDCLSAPAPHLRSLDIDNRIGGTLLSGDSSSEHALMIPGAAPNLADVRLSGVSIPWNAPLLRGLRSLSLEFPRFSRPKCNPPTLRELVEILQGCPRLQSLTLGEMPLGPSDQPQAPTRVSLNQLTSLRTSGLSIGSTCDILQCIQCPRTSLISVSIGYLVPDDDKSTDLGTVLSRLPQSRFISPICIEIHRPHLTLSTTNCRVTVQCSNEERENARARVTYKDLLAGVDAPIRAAVTSLHMDSIASQNSSAILIAASELLPNLTQLSIPPYHRLKSKKPWHTVLGKVVQCPEGTNRPMCLCPKITSLEITTTVDYLDISSILELVRIRGSDRRLKGKEVEKSHITSIRITLNHGNLSTQQTDLLNELKGEVADVQVDCASPFEDEAQNESDCHSEPEPSA